MEAILDCPHLRKLHLFTAQSEFKTASFTSESFRNILENLRLLEDFGIDRDMFGRDRLTADFVTVIPINHPKLLSFRIISTFVRAFLPYIEYAPNLLAFTATNHLESVASLEALSLFSLNLRSLQLRFDRNELVQIERENSAPSTRQMVQDDMPMGLSASRPIRRKRSNSSNDVNKLVLTLPEIARTKAIVEISSPRTGTPRRIADLISECFSRIRTLTHVSLFGATERLTNSLHKLTVLAHLTLSYCILPTDTLIRLLQNIPSLRKLDLERCSSLDSIQGVRSNRLANLHISSCNDLIGDDLSFTGTNFPSLEILSVSQQVRITSIAVRDLPELRWATFTRISGAQSIIISDVPKLTDIALEGVTTVKLHVVAPVLHRMFLDCSRTEPSASSLNPGPDLDVPVVLKMPELRRLSWQADDTETDYLLDVLKETPKIEIIELPAYEVEEVEPLYQFLRENCPLVKLVGCGDGDADPWTAGGETLPKL